MPHAELGGLGLGLQGRAGRARAKAACLMQSW